jgi:RNA-binding protein YlmH
MEISRQIDRLRLAIRQYEGFGAAMLKTIYRGKLKEVVIVQRRDILDRLQGEERSLLASAWDQAERAAYRGQVNFTGFLDPGQRSLLVDYSHLWAVSLQSYGGYDDAEREIVAFVPEGYHAVMGQLEPSVFPMAAVQATGNFQFAQVSHRDFLGSLLALGLKRELFGDILVQDQGCQLILHEHALPLVLANWAAVGSVGIDLRQVALEDLRPPLREKAERTATVATLRLDAVLAAAYGVSRSKAADLIRAGKVKLNFRPETRVDRLLAAGAMLSLAGCGRAELLEVGGSSRSGRVFIKVARWH